MTEADRAPFFTLLASVYAFYGKDFSSFAGRVWWRAMQPFDLAAVTDALDRHCINPDTGQYKPQPADIRRMLQGSTQEAALVAWAIVDWSIRTVGTYASVVFTDPLIHRVVYEMGGWIPMGTKSEEEWPFVRNEFVNRYRGYRMRNETPVYPPLLMGIVEAQNKRSGSPSDPPIMIGDMEKAKCVLTGGTKAPLLNLTRLTPAEVVKLHLTDQKAA